MASNKDTLDDGFGASSDWIEIHNAGDESIDLLGYYLSDSQDALDKWSFLDSTPLGPGEYLVVFASGHGSVDPEGNQHTNFKLKAGGEYLALSDTNQSLLSAIGDNGADYPPQFSDISYGVANNSETGFLITATPGEANSATYPQGPLIVDVTATPEFAVAGQPIVVTAEIQPFMQPIDPSSVQMTFRRNYGNEISIGMRDDGLGGDAVANDSLFTATIPGSAVATGEMLRWYVSAANTIGDIGRAPRFIDPTDSAEYFGTVVPDPTASTDIPVLYWFVEAPTRAQTERGTRGSLMFRGVFYDNIQTDLHGQSTSGSAFPKKSFDFDANSGEKFDFADDVAKASDFNLLTNYGDQTKLRHPLAYEVFRQAGVPTRLAFPVSVHRNGEFLGLYDFVEESDEEQLVRMGMDPNNNLYKVNNDLTSAWSEVEQKAGLDESRADLVQVINANRLSTRNGRVWDWDNLDIADTVNYFAANYIIRNQDFGNKNMYWYHDVSGTGLWSVQPWDLDLSFGHNWTRDVSPPYFDNTLYVTGGLDAGWNRLMQRLVTSDSVFRQMLNRRLRTLMDELMGPPGTSTDDSFLGQQIQSRRDLLLDEIAADVAVWGIQSNYSAAYPFTPQQAIEEQLDSWLPDRRAYMESRSSIPNAHAAASDIRIGAIEFNPPSGDLGEQYVVIENHETFAVDISGWKIAGAMSHTFKPATVVPAGGELYLVSDVQGFLARSASPHGGQQRFIQASASGAIAPHGGVLQLANAHATGIDAAQYGRTGDITNDGVMDCIDIDAITQITIQNVYVESFDVDGDGALNSDDIDAWLAQASLLNLEPGEHYQYGDGNLDGVVNEADFDIWNSNRFTSTAKWCDGDYNNDGFVDISDFNLWNTNRTTDDANAANSAQVAPKKTATIRIPRAAPKPIVVDVSDTHRSDTTNAGLIANIPAKPIKRIGLFAKTNSDIADKTADSPGPIPSSQLAKTNSAATKVAEPTDRFRFVRSHEEPTKPASKNGLEVMDEPMSILTRLFRWGRDV